MHKIWRFAKTLYKDSLYNRGYHILLPWTARIVIIIYMLCFHSTGTLLGAVKYGDVLPWDGDADMSSIYHQEFNPSTMNAEFATSYGIHRNGLIARVNNSQLDYYRWTVTDGTFNGIQEKVLKSYYPKWITDSDNVLVKLEHSREMIPLSWVVPTKKIDFAGASVAVPKEYEKVLDSRYPLTYRYGIFTPYKWKCWFPSWFTGGKSCKKPFAKRRKQTIIWNNQATCFHRAIQCYRIVFVKFWWLNLTMKQTKRYI